MSVSATISSGTPTVGGSLTCSGQATGGESLTGYQWQSSDNDGGAYSNIAGATSQSWDVLGAYRCKWVRCQVAFDDSGSTVYAYTSPLRIGPCGGGGKNKRDTAKAIMQDEAEAAKSSPQPSRAGVVKGRLRKVYKVDAQKFVRRGY